MDAQRPGALTPAPPESRVRAAGLRSTRPRVTVLDVLDGGGHRTADELVADLSARGTALPRSTVFNVLDDLVEAGLVLRADLGSGAAYYESAAIADPHHHFVCRVCGTIQDVDVDDVGDLSVPDDPRFEIDSLQVVFRGVCAACRS